MLATLLTVLLAFALIGAAPARGDEPPATEAAEQAAATEPEEAKSFKPPPGYKPMKRGGKTVYCRESTPIGSRLKAVECFDEQRLRQIELERQQSNQEIERQRKICPGGTICN